MILYCIYTDACVSVGEVLCGVTETEISFAVYMERGNP